MSGVPKRRLHSVSQSEAACLEAAQLVARTTAHYANNGLSPALGYALLLAEHPTVQADSGLAQFVLEVVTSITNTTATIRQLNDLTRLVEDNVLSFPGGALLDLDASTEP